MELSMEENIQRWTQDENEMYQSQLNVHRMRHHHHHHQGKFFFFFSFFFFCF